MAWGHGLVTIASDGSILDAWYPEVFLGDAPKSDLQWFSPRELDSMVGQDEIRGVRTEVIRTEIDLTLPVANTQDAYLRLHLLSHLVVEPNTINLEGLIPNLPIVAFTNRGVMRLEDFEARTITLRDQGIVAHDLKRSDFGKVVMGLYMHPQETPTLKRQLKKLIERWSRPIFQKSGNMKDLEHVHGSRGGQGLAAMNRAHHAAAAAMASPRSGAKSTNRKAARMAVTAGGAVRSGRWPIATSTP